MGGGGRRPGQNEGTRIMADHARTVQDIYEAFGRGDVPFILERLDEDIVWDEGIRDTGLAYLRPGHGRDHVGEFFGALATTVRFDVFEPVSICVGGDTVTAIIREAGQNIQSGRNIDQDLVVHVWTFGSDGKVASFRHIGDFALHERAAVAHDANV